MEKRDKSAQMIKMKMLLARPDTFGLAKVMERVTWEGQHS